MRMLLLRALPALFGLAAAAQAAPTPRLSDIGELPGEKTPLILKAKESNPFTRHETKTAEVADDRESEESQLRAILGAMPVTGVIRSPDSTTVLLGNLILKPGRPLPELLKNQTEHLVVASTTAKQVEIQFVETEEHAEPRKILIAIDLHPRVVVHTPIPPVPAKDPTNTIRAPHSEADIFAR